MKDPFVAGIFAIAVVWAIIMCTETRAGRAVGGGILLVVGLEEVLHLLGVF